MRLNQRLTDIVRFLFINTNPINSYDLSHYFDISERTLRSDIKTINIALRDNGGIIEQIRGEGYKLLVYDIDKFDYYIDLQSTNRIDTRELETTDKRMKFIMLNLLYADDFVSIEELANSVFVSNSTILNYIKSIKDTFHEYNLRLTNKINLGYRLEGTEDAKRNCILGLISSDITDSPVLFSNEQSTIFSSLDLESIRTIILRHGSKAGIRFSDLNLKNLILHTALMLSRIEKNAFIDDYTLPEFDKNVRDTIDQMLEEIEYVFDVVIPKGERNYIYTHFFSNSPTAIQEISKTDIDNIIILILERLLDMYGYDLRNDKILIEDLKAHLQSILTLQYFNLNKKNPLLNIIKSSFPFEFEITLVVTEDIFNHSESIMTEDEVAYIALHIGAAIERYSAENRRIKRVMLVCGSGSATTRMIEAQLISHFQNRILITHKLSYHELLNQDVDNVDLIISTVPSQEQLSVPTVFVDLPLSQRHLDNIELQIGDDNDFFQLAPLFSEHHFFPNCQINDKEVLIRTLSEKLYKDSIVNKEFVESVLQRETMASTLMDDMIAIPHPLTPNSSSTIISVAILDKPILWKENETAQIIFLLAIAEKDRDNIEFVYKSLVGVMNNPRIQNQMLKTKNIYDFINLLRLEEKI